MMIDEELPILEAHASNFVEELKSAARYGGKGAMLKVTILRELRRLLSKSEFPPVEAAFSSGAIPLRPLLVKCLSFGSPDEQVSYIGLIYASMLSVCYCLYLPSILL